MREEQWQREKSEEMRVKRRGRQEETVRVIEQKQCKIQERVKGKDREKREEG